MSRSEYEPDLVLVNEGLGHIPPPALEIGQRPLESLALEALILDDHDLAVELIDQLTPTEAETVVTAAAALASLAADVVADGCRSELGHKGARAGRHLRVVA
jgi:hypothetical protein